VGSSSCQVDQTQIGDVVIVFIFNSAAKDEEGWRAEVPPPSPAAQGHPPARDGAEGGIFKQGSK
jgi:hypothetical protein